MRRTGAALPAVLLLILLLSGLGGLAVATARLRALTAARTIAQAKGLTVAEAGLDRAEARWDPILAAGLAVGAAQGLPPSAPANGTVVRDTLLRLGHSLFLARSTGEALTPDGHLLARAAVARLIRVVAPVIPDSVAALVAGGVLVAADSGIQGEDAVPAGWDLVCAPTAAADLALGHAPGAGIALTCPGGTCLSGSPQTAVDSSLPASLFSGLGVGSLAALAAHQDAGVSGPTWPAPVVAGGICDRTRGDNWGDPGAPGAPCGPYFPIVVAGTGAELTGGAGQGLLLATGDLVLSGASRFAGVVLAVGDVTLRDRAELLGTILVQGSLVVADSARIRRSVCAIRRALGGSARPLRPVPRGTLRWP